jgi:hypothetical protein
MIVESERFFGGLIVDDDRSKRRIGLKYGNQIESEPALEIPMASQTSDDITLWGPTVHGNIKW